MQNFGFDLQMFAATEVSTLNELKTAVATGWEIRLTSDITDISETIEISNTVTLDLNGHTVSGNVNQWQGIFLLNSTAKVTFKDSVGDGLISNVASDGGEYRI